MITVLRYFQRVRYLDESAKNASNPLVSRVCSVFLVVGNPLEPEFVKSKAAVRWRYELSRELTFEDRFFLCPSLLYETNKPTFMPSENTDESY